MYHWTYRTATYSPHIIIDDGEVNVEPAPTYVAPVRLLAKVRPTVQPTTVIQSQPRQQQIFWAQQQAPPTIIQQQPSVAKKGSGSVCLIIFVILILVIICVFLGLMFLFEAHRKAEGHHQETKEEDQHCYMPHLMGNGICEREVMYDSRCQYDAQDCKLNEQKEEIAAMICAAIRLRLKDSTRDCQHHYYKKHPYCEPCGKLDKSWSYLIDELKVTAGKWLKKEPAELTTSTTISFTTTAGYTTETEGT